MSEDRERVKQMFTSLRAKGFGDEEILAAYDRWKAKQAPAQPRSASLEPDVFADRPAGLRMPGTAQETPSPTPQAEPGVLSSIYRSIAAPLLTIDPRASEEEMREHVRDSAASSVGLMTGGATNVALKAAPKAIGPVTKGVVGSYVTGKAARAAGADAVGEDATAAANNEDATDADMLIGGAVPLLGMTAAVGSDALRRMSKWTKRYGEAREAGVFNRPDMRGVPSSEEGKQIVADRAQQTIAKKSIEKLRAVGEKHEAAKLSLERNTPYHDSSPAIAALDEIAKKNTTARTGAIRDDALDAAIQEARRLMDIDPETGLAHIDDLLEARRTLAARAKYGKNQTPTRENLAYKKIERAIDKAIPDEIKEIDDAYHAQATENERLNDALYRKRVKNVSRGVREDGTPDIDSALEEAGARRIARYADDTLPSYSQRRAMERIRRMDPAYAEQLDLATAQAAKMATLPGGNRVQDTMSALVKQGQIVPFLQQNARAFSARAADPALTATRDLLAERPLSASVGAIINARLAEKERDEERARKLKKGGKR